MERNRTKNKTKANIKPPIDPVNPYTGEVSILAIFENMQRGYNHFPDVSDPTKPIKWKHDSEYE
jgi:hypothetical protein